MLINHLSAKNFRKYNKLEISDIPETGTITIAGSNESGKTSIGEAICFALYGRTFFLDEKNLKKIICWGTDLAEVTLRFTTDEGDSYSLYRSISRDGSLNATLERKSDGSDKNTKDASVISTEESVDKALSKILGFDYDSFANSFYLVQRELTSPDPQSESIKQMAGIGDYARITTELQLSNKENKEKVAEISPEIETTQTTLDAINLDETWLPELVDAEQTLGSEQNSREQLVEHLNNNEQFYTQNSQKYSSAKTKRSFLGFLSILLLPIAIILWLLWAAVNYFPELLLKVTGGLSESFNTSLAPFLASFSESWLLPVAIISTLGYFISWFAKNTLKNKMLDLSGEAISFGASLKDGHRHVTTQVETLLPERVVQMLYGKNKEKPTLLVIPQREQFSNLSQLIEDTPEYKAKPEELSAAVSRLSECIKKQDEDIIGINEGLLIDIDKEKIRSDEAGVLRSSLQTLNNVVKKCNYSIDIQSMAIDMLKRAADDSITLFNNNIADISAKALPVFTEGCYSEIKISEDLSVQVYSDGKKDYMDFDEISSGTQRQIMLALRMAMSEELSKNTGNEKQFIFLDEPFAFFDQSRTISTLNGLPEVSDVITQIWMVAQEFPDGANADKVINCPSESTELVV